MRHYRRHKEGKKHPSRERRATAGLSASTAREEPRWTSSGWDDTREWGELHHREGNTRCWEWSCAFIVTNGYKGLWCEVVGNICGDGRVGLSLSSTFLLQVSSSLICTYIIWLQAVLDPFLSVCTALWFWFMCPLFSRTNPVKAVQIWCILMKKSYYVLPTTRRVIQAPNPRQRHGVFFFARPPNLEGFYLERRSRMLTKGSTVLVDGLVVFPFKF